MDKKFNLTISVVIAICAYTLLLFLIVLYLKEYPIETKKFSSMPKETLIELDFVDKDNNQNEQVLKQELLESQENVIQDVSSSPDMKSVTNLKSLFSNISDIGTKKPVLDETTEKPQNQTMNRFKSKIEAENTTQKIELLKLIDVKNGSNSAKSSIVATNKGNFDEYYSMINTYILRKWYNFPLLTDVNYLVTANITIDSSGNFSFVMLKFSGDNRVDGAIKLFLRNQSLEKYPVSPDKLIKTIRINFKPYLD